MSIAAKAVATADLHTPPAGATAVLVLEDGSIHWGRGFGAVTTRTGELCFNTSITGYQEIITDPSYAGQIITFTFPHIGNVGANDEDVETATPASCGCVVKADVTEPSNFRAAAELGDWLSKHDLPGISGIDTRALTRRIRKKGAPNAVLCHAPDGKFDLPSLLAKARGFHGLEGLDLAKDVTRTQNQDWDGNLWDIKSGYGAREDATYNVVAMDFGVKDNILRCLTSIGAKVTVVPANTSADDILALNPDGIFLSNGPGDPAATGDYAVPTIQKLVDSGKPVFGICLGHQMLCLALGAKSEKMHQGHRGGNHPVKDLETGKVEITSQNHGFVVNEDSLPDGVIATHRSLFDGTLEGVRVEGKPVFAVQYHPEASPGPKDSHYLFERFADLMATAKKA